MQIGRKVMMLVDVSLFLCCLLVLATVGLFSIINGLWSDDIADETAPLQTYSAPKENDENLLPDTKQNETAVYISRTGNKYHFAGCQYINENMIETDIVEAARLGYEPCKRCGE